MQASLKVNSRGQRPGPGVRLHKSPKLRSSPQRISLLAGLCWCQKAATEITGLLPPDKGTVCSWRTPKFWRQRKTKQKPAIRLKQSPCVLISAHLHKNHPLWLNSCRWVKALHVVLWPEGSPQRTAQHCTPQEGNVAWLAVCRLFGPVLPVVNVSSLPQQLTNRNF